MTKQFRTSKPCHGDRILIFRRGWLERIFSGEKTMEIRGTRLHEGDVWLGCKSQVLGKARLGAGIHIETESQWTALRPQHLVSDSGLPYKKTWGLPLCAITRLRKAVPFRHPRGAIGIVRFNSASPD